MPVPKAMADSSPLPTPPPEPSDLTRLDLRVATVLAARPNPAARGPAVVLELDLGPELGRRTSSARLAADYAPEDLIGTQVVVAAGFAPRRIAGVVSEVLVLAAVDPGLGTKLLRIDVPVPPGTPVG